MWRVLGATIFKSRSKSSRSEQKRERATCGALPFQFANDLKRTAPEKSMNIRKRIGYSAIYMTLDPGREFVQTVVAQI